MSLLEGTRGDRAARYSNGFLQMCLARPRCSSCLFGQASDTKEHVPKYHGGELRFTESQPYHGQVRCLLPQEEARTRAVGVSLA